MRDPKTTYAQSSDIKSRIYLEYRKDMKRKAIVELEVLEWLENKLKELYPGKEVKVYKSGGDKFLWFLRKGGVTGDADFTAEIDGGKEKLEIELQYTEREGLKFYDFKKTKVIKKGLPIKNKLFLFIHKPKLMYAIFDPEWIVNNGRLDMVPAWRSVAYRVPKENIENIIKPDDRLKDILAKVEMKKYILDFQHQLIEINKEILSRLLQSVIDEKKIVKIIPKDLDSFFKVCFILDNINKVPENANLWLIYILTYINNELSLEKIYKIVYCIDFLYSKVVELQKNEVEQLIPKIEELIRLIKSFYKNDGSYTSEYTVSPLEETRYALFSINLLEDIIQDIIYYYPEWSENLKPINKIYQNVEDIGKTYNMIKTALDEKSKKLEIY
jgi:hypothetical protein